MTRPLRLEFAGALYHITSRGDRREDIFECDDDREDWLELLGLVCQRFNWVVHAFCQMSNHYHLLVETVDGNLSRGMRQLNGEYTQRFNRRHGKVGHLFQGRYKAILVQKETYLLELSRYVVLNPVRARMVDSVEMWPWSSYPMMAGLTEAPTWLDCDWLLTQFGTLRSEAFAAYQRFVIEGAGLASPLEQTRYQLLLGQDEFVARYREQGKSEILSEQSKAQKRALALSLTEYQASYPNRNDAMAMAYLSGSYAMAEIAEHFGVHYMTVSRAVKAFEQR